MCYYSNKRRRSNISNTKIGFTDRKTLVKKEDGNFNVIMGAYGAAF